MSHGCVNMPTSEAEWAYNWSTYGTPVVVFGDYAYGAPPRLGKSRSNANTRGENFRSISSSIQAQTGQ